MADLGVAGSGHRRISGAPLRTKRRDIRHSQDRDDRDFLSRRLAGDHHDLEKGATSGILKIVMIVIFFLVGWLEIISILFRPISLSFRLFGNIYTGGSVLEALSTLNPYLAPLLPLPFYFLEVLVGFVQALVFMLLTAIFTLLIASHGPEHAHS